MNTILGQILLTTKTRTVFEGKGEFQHQRITEFKDHNWATKTLKITKELADFEWVCYRDSLELDSGTYLLSDDQLTTVSESFNHKRSFKEKVYFIISLAEVMQHLHKQGIVYNKINEYDVAVCGKGKAVLCDFSLAHLPAEEMSLETMRPYLVNEYISPELTGRTDERIDFRSDFYSLGILMYKIFTGLLPFESNDIGEIFAMHVAKNPIPPTEINADIPENLSRIILKLLSKLPDERYQSFKGLLYDLKHFEKADFKAGEYDVDTAFKISQKVYGRESELDELSRIVSEVSKGEFYISSIAGYSGVGKSTLVSEANKIQENKKTIFLTGKFQQYKQSIPYFAIVEAFNEYFNELLLQSKEVLDDFIARFKETIGDQGAILTSVFPELELIVGKQKEVEKQIGSEAENRFNYVFLQFVELIANANSPLILFLDDLQWTDLVSLNVLKALVKSDKKYIMLGLAYRDNEVDIHHPFHHFLEEVSKMDVNLHTIKLLDLKTEDICQLVKDSRIKNYRELGELIHQKTKGNSFFVHQFLKNIVDRDLLSYLDTSNQWQVELQQLQELKISENVVDFMQDRIQKFGKETQDILSTIGASGHNVDLKVLETILKRKTEDILHLIATPLQDGLLIRKDNHIFFVHDKIQQACYQLNSPEELPRLHFDIANILIESGLNKSLNELFSIVSHLENAFDFAKAEPEKYFEIFLQAAIRSKEISAYKEFMRYIEKCMDLIFPGIDKDLEFRANSEFHIALHLNARYEEANDFFYDKILKYDDIFSLKDNYVTKVSQDSMLGKYQDATEFGLSILEKLGVRVNMYPDIEELRRELNEIRELYKKNNINNVFDLLNIEKKKPKEMAFLCELISAIVPGSFFFTPLVSSLLIFETIKLAIKNGVYESMGYPFSVATAPFMLIENNYVTGYEYAEFAIKISGNDKRSVGNSKHLFILFCWHWLKPLKDNESLQIAREAFHLLLQGGDIQMSGFIFFNTIPYQFERGDHLEDVLIEVDKGLDYANKTANFHAQGPYSVWEQFMLTMLAEDSTTDHFSVNGFDETNYLEKNEQNTMGRCFLYIYKNQLVYMFNHFDTSLETSFKAQEVISSIAGFIPMSTHFFYAALTWCRYLDQKPELQEPLNQYIAQLKLWADQIKANWLQKYHLAEAERSRFTHNDLDAVNHYELAIKAARQNGFIQDLALIKERFGEFWLNRGNEEIGEVYIKLALESYSKWGAIRKVKALKEQYPTIFIESDDYNIDLKGIIKSQNALAQETNLESLLRKMLKVLLEVSGAEKCILAMQKDEWLIEAYQDMDGNEQFMQKIPVTDASLSTDLFNYAIRTKRVVLLSDLKGQIKDKYCITHNPKSILMLPIISQSRILAVINLEHSKIENLFSQTKQETIKLLSTQIAISIINAQMYNNLEGLVQDRTQELEVINEELGAMNEELSTTIEALNQQSTAKEKALEELKRSEKQLIESNVAKDKFFSIIAHDLKGPIGSISNILTSLHEGEIDFNTTLLESITKSSSQVYDLLDDLLIWARSQNKTLKAVPVPLELNTLLKTALNTFDLSARKKSISLKLEEAAPGSAIFADKSMVNTVIRNFLSNAIKFTPPEKSIVVSTRETASSFIINVTDQGVGIQQDTIDKVIKKGESIGSIPGTNDEKGTGMGLLVCKELIKMSNGKIGAKSEPGKGSRFWFELPKVTDAELSSTESLKTFLKKHTILYVEDNPVHVENGSLVLQSIGVKWDVAGNGRDGLLAFSKKTYSIVFLDINLPDINGIQLARNMRNVQKNGLYLFALTSYTEAEVAEMGAINLFDGFLNKPLNLDELKSIISKVV